MQTFDTIRIRGARENNLRDPDRSSAKTQTVREKEVPVQDYSLHSLRKR